jgi:hypothetical protein
MKKIKVLYFFALLFSVISCNKDENPTTGCADKVVGAYNGTMYHGVAYRSCTSEIVKTADTKVKLTIIMGGSIFIVEGIAVKNAPNNTYNLSYTDPTGYLGGEVAGDTLTYSINVGVLNDIFTGTR